ncbi:hypothetical protein L1049_017662 [Liquidambar formosana]|uniref:Uncharacterized protein n=1 Tax=Liquidambar formosana TaxID=63359 RepID=A0AAP0S158_LIQFO
MPSGFGGLGFDGMVGTEDTIGEGSVPPGEGKSGAMSGDISIRGEDRGGFERSAGEAEMVVVVVEVSKFSGEDKDGKGEEAMKATIMSATRNQKEAIFNDGEIISTASLESV